VNEILKQRLVGALILLALGVVFWPIVFVEPEQKATAQPRSIPEPPAVSTVDIEAPGQAGLRASPALTANEDGNEDGNGNEELANSTESTAAPAEAVAASTKSAATTEVRSEAPQPLTVDAEGVPVAWTLQVATVSSAENAEALRKRLLDKNEKAYITKVSSSGKQLYRVCVGPKFERQELERMQASINA
jgi:DedD protein